MAYPGYLAIGLEDAELGTHAVEIVNTNRALAYAREVGPLPWLGECDECDDIDAVIPDGTYGAPWSDPAPWFTPKIPDSAGFCGVIGLSVDGIEDSTRYARVTKTIVPSTFGGSIGATYEGPRVITVRALAVADAECSLSYGLRWLNEQWLTSGSACLGDPLSFFDCCPDARCTEETDVPVGPCWPTTYAELRDGPACSPDWWPSTYADLKAGPPYLRTEGSGDWCDWVGVYRELKDWLPPWSCCHELNVIPHWRSMARARVTAGPNVLQRPSMSVGAVAEIEIQITCGDPTAERMAYYWGETFSQATTWTTRPGST